MTSTFDAETHTYRIGGAIVPSVTQVIKEVGWVDTTGFNDAARDRGTLVHAALAGLDSGKGCELPGEYSGYLHAWEAFRRESGMDAWQGIELPAFSEAYLFAGTVDRFNRDFIVDIKTGDVPWWGKYQLAAYSLLLGGQLRVGMVVGLGADGTYTAKSYQVLDMVRAQRVFLSALTTCQTKRAEAK